MSETLKKPVLETKHLGISFGGLHAVQDFNLSICSGELVGLIGPNGAGKTTVFNLLTGVYVPTAGTVLLDGVPLNGKKVHQFGGGRRCPHLPEYPPVHGYDRYRKRQGDLQQGSALQSGGRHVPHAEIRKAEREITEKALDLLEMVRLAGAGGRAAASLPYGQQRKLEIARALATNMKVLLLDEPAAGMNPTETAELVLLRQYHPGPVRHCHSADRA